MLFTADCGGLFAWLLSTSATNESFVVWTLMVGARLPFWRLASFCAPCWSVTQVALSPPPSDGSGPDVRRRLHGGRRLSTHLPDHRQLPPVPPTQTLAFRITLHEHAQRRECGVPAFIRGHPSIASICITACRLASFLGPQEQRWKNWWIRQRVCLWRWHCASSLPTKGLTPCAAWERFFERTVYLRFRK